MGEQYESMMEGLTELLEYAKGDKSKGRVRVVELLNIQVKPLKRYNKEELRSIRLKNNLTLKTFADCLGVSKKMTVTVFVPLSSSINRDINYSSLPVSF